MSLPPLFPPCLADSSPETTVLSAQGEQGREITCPGSHGFEATGSECKLGSGSCVPCPGSDPCSGDCLFETLALRLPWGWREVNATEQMRLKQRFIPAGWGLSCLPTNQVQGPLSSVQSVKWSSQPRPDQSHCSSEPAILLRPQAGSEAQAALGACRSLCPTLQSSEGGKPVLDWGPRT